MLTDIDASGLLYVDPHKGIGVGVSSADDHQRLSGLLLERIMALLVKYN